MLGVDADKLLGVVAMEDGVCNKCILICSTVSRVHGVEGGDGVLGRWLTCLLQQHFIFESKRCLITIRIMASVVTTAQAKTPIKS